jgi:hypothetical protein
LEYCGNSGRFLVSIRMTFAMCTIKSRVFCSAFCVRASLELPPKLCSTSLMSPSFRCLVWARFLWFQVPIPSANFIFDVQVFEVLFLGSHDSSGYVHSSTSSSPSSISSHGTVLGNSVLADLRSTSLSLSLGSARLLWDWFPLSRDLCGCLAGALCVLRRCLRRWFCFWGSLALGRTSVVRQVDRLRGL